MHFVRLSKIAYSFFVICICLNYPTSKSSKLKGLFLVTYIVHLQPLTFLVYENLFGSYG